MRCLLLILYFLKILVVNINYYNNDLAIMLDITTSCRTCMKDNVTLVDLYEIVEVEENYLQLAELLVQCTPIEVSSR